MYLLLQLGQFFLHTLNLILILQDYTILFSVLILFFILKVAHNFYISPNYWILEEWIKEIKEYEPNDYILN